VTPYLFTYNFFKVGVSNQDYVAANDWVIMNWKDAVVIVFKTLTLHVPGGTGGTRKSVSQINRPGKIRTGIAEIRLYYKLCKLYIIWVPR
jgi:hypothetical protein